ncbi:hypothetical protein CCE29_07690 [Lacticaseibacillus rhamnosus]|uniref:ATP-dependent nuclease subunit B n=1 Tax=Lacticaseibacillus rhamnosus TaxID=47715 RepID=A0AAX0JYE2_LACRH|nr:hypothetical protein B4583_12135 [Lacticaseibacillus rhamnosus]AXI95663.1 ATP-dependent nuclease subunit B [Lacticaseibacillus rhamnosus GG]ART95842.1 hypothetical protein CCE29_07690 [Lacticaseibacillus rhamnosus]AZZ24329.1 ATP-dependent nuclease subunit B [Lacticaseibacillus rhamnosus]MCT3192902.1 ATP-dependent nuclease subunit B [Lacticaseibacillus rhamnosus]
MHSCEIIATTRSPAQESACKDLGRNGQNRAITPQATYTPIPERAGSRSPYKKIPLSLVACVAYRQADL